MSQKHPTPVDKGRSSEKGGSQSETVLETEATGVAECEASSRKRNIWNRKGENSGCNCGRSKNPQQCQNVKWPCKEKGGDFMLSGHSTFGGNCVQGLEEQGTGRNGGMPV